MINQPALKDLMAFNANPSAKNGGRLICIPAVYNALKYEGKHGQAYSSPLLSVCLWLECRALEVLASHTLGCSMLAEFRTMDERGWEEVG